MVEKRAADESAPPCTTSVGFMYTPEASQYHEISPTEIVNPADLSLVTLIPAPTFTEVLSESLNPLPTPLEPTIDMHSLSLTIVGGNEESVATQTLDEATYPGTTALAFATSTPSLSCIENDIIQPGTFCDIETSEVICSGTEIAQCSWVDTAAGQVSNYIFLPCPEGTICTLSSGRAKCDICSSDSTLEIDLKSDLLSGSIETATNLYDTTSVISPSPEQASSTVENYSSIESGSSTRESYIIPSDVLPTLDATPLHVSSIAEETLISAAYYSPQSASGDSYNQPSDYVFQAYTLASAPAITSLAPYSVHDYYATSLISPVDDVSASADSNPAVPTMDIAPEEYIANEKYAVPISSAKPISIEKSRHIMHVCAPVNPVIVGTSCDADTSPVICSGSSIAQCACKYLILIIVKDENNNAEYVEIPCREGTSCSMQSGTALCVISSCSHTTSALYSTPSLSDYPEAVTKSPVDIISQEVYPVPSTSTTEVLSTEERLSSVYNYESLNSADGGYPVPSKTGYASPETAVPIESPLSSTADNGYNAPSPSPSGSVCLTKAPIDLCPSLNGIIPAGTPCDLNSQTTCSGHDIATCKSNLTISNYSFFCWCRCLFLHALP